jgi:hypothetical protein
MNTTPIADQHQDRRDRQNFLINSCTPVRDDSGEGVIGWIVEADHPAGEWIAIFPDLDDMINDPQLPKRWSKSLPDSATAEGHVRSNYRAWLRRQG